MICPHCHKEIENFNPRCNDCIYYDKERGYCMVDNVPTYMVHFCLTKKVENERNGDNYE